MRAPASVRAAILAVAWLCLAGMAVLQPEEVRLMQQSRYGELERLMLKEIPDPSRARFERLIYLCFAHSRVKRYQALFPCVDHLQKRVEAGDFRLFVFDMSAVPALLRAEAWLELGDYRRSLAEAEVAYARTRDRSAYLQMRIYAVTAMALGHALSGNRSEGLRYAAELEGIGTGYPNTLLATDKYTGLAKTYIALREYARALDAIRRDRETEGFRGLADLVSGSAATGASLFTYWVLPRDFMMAKAQLETGDVAGAKAGYDRLLGMPQARDNGDIHWLLLFDRGRIAEREGQAAESIRWYREAVEVIERQRATINTEASKIGFVGDKQALYRQLVGVLVAEGRAALAFEYAERAKSRALVDLLAATRDLAVRQGNEAQLRALVTMGDAAEAEARVQSEVARDAAGQSRSLAGKARAELAAQAPELASLVSVSYLAADQMRAALRPDEALVEYFYGGETLFAFLATREAVQAQRLDARGLEADVREFRRAVANPLANGHLERAQSLYGRLIKPFEDALEGRALTIVPHGALHYLPFAALHDGSRYLVERAGIRVLPSASVLRYLRVPAGGPAQPVLALGNPDLGDARYDLGFAQAEAEAVAALAPQSRTLVRREATETAFREAAGAFNVLHIASHGEFNADAPLQSALFLARDPQNDGRLTVAELYGLRLSAELVVLSACETGLGSTLSGDDVVGLSRGFLYAGGNSVVASLWKVDDLATGQLMTRFYENLRQLDKREALRQAQLQVKGTRPHPFFWAAFQLTGSDR
jgi:CHAT domain-containing protein